MKDLENEYQEMLKRAQKGYSKINLENRTNCYICSTCGSVTKTKDIDKGVTPMFITCQRCKKNMAHSSFYNDVAPFMTATYEWYRPSLKEFLKSDKGTQQHVLNGGLIYRKVKQIKNK